MIPKHEANKQARHPLEQKRLRARSDILERPFEDFQHMILDQLDDEEREGDDDDAED
jgi:hypothetical protein